MNNVKLARKFLWALILTAVCSRGYAAPGPAVTTARTTAAVTQTVSALERQVAELRVELLSLAKQAKETEALQAKIAEHENAIVELNKSTLTKASELCSWAKEKGFSGLVTDVQDFTTSFLEKNQEYVAMAQNGCLGLVTIAGTSYLVYESGKFLVNLESVKAKIESAKKHYIVTGLTGTGLLAGAATTGYFFPSVVKSATTAALNASTNAYVAGAVATASVLTLAYQKQLHTWLWDKVKAAGTATVEAAKNHPYITGTVAATGLGAAGTAFWKNAFGSRQVVTDAASNVCGWVTSAANKAVPTIVSKNPKVTALVFAGAASGVLAYKYWPTRTASPASTTPAAPAKQSFYSRLTGYFTGKAKAEEAKAASKADAVKLMTADVNAVRQYMGHASVPTSFAEFAKTNKAFANVSTEFTTRLGQLQNQGANAINAERAQVIAEFTAKIKAVKA